jgi:hypothetical protein
MQELQVRVATGISKSSGMTGAVFGSDGATFGAIVSVVLLITFPFFTKRLIIQ